MVNHRHRKFCFISHQRALLKAGASMVSREASQGDAFGGSVEVQRAHESAARDAASGGGNQENTQASRTCNEAWRSVSCPRSLHL